MLRGCPCSCDQRDAIGCQLQIPIPSLTMLDSILYQPEISPNTGNIIRLCGNTGAWLHVVKPLGVDLDSSGIVTVFTRSYGFLYKSQPDNLAERIH